MFFVFLFTLLWPRIPGPEPFVPHQSGVPFRNLSMHWFPLAVLIAQDMGALLSMRISVWMGALLAYSHSLRSGLSRPEFISPPRLSSIDGRFVLFYFAQVPFHAARVCTSPHVLLVRVGTHDHSRIYSNPTHRFLNLNIHNHVHWNLSLVLDAYRSLRCFRS